MKLQEAADRLGISERTLRKWLKTGRISGVKVPGFRGLEWSIDAVSLEEARKKAGRSEGIEVPGFRGSEPGKEAPKTPEEAGRPEAKAGRVPPSPPVLPPELEARLARIEGALTGQWITEFRAELQASKQREEALAAKLETLVAENTQLHSEVVRWQQEAQVLARQQEALLEELKGIRQALTRPPWWKQMWLRALFRRNQRER